MLVLAYWLLRWQGRLWRHTVRAEAGGSLDALRAALQAEVRPLWTGWRVQGQRARVDYRGGLFGFRTRVRVDRALVLDREGLASADEVLRALGERGAGSEPRER